jgi:hypothetical protein
MNSTKIEPVLSALRQAPNERWYNFHREADKIMVRWTPARLGIEALYPAYVDLVQKADVLLEQVSKSWLTGEIKHFDGERDRCINGLKAAVRALLKSPIQDKRVAANKLNILLNTYGDMAKMEYDAETAAVINLLQDLNGSKYAQHVKTAELGDWVTELERFNTRVDELVGERYAEKSEKPAEKLIEVRRDVDSSFGKLLTLIEGTMIANPAHGLNEFVRELNIVIKHYKTLATQDKGRRNAKKTDTEE